MEDSEKNLRKNTYRYGRCRAGLIPFTPVHLDRLAETNAMLELVAAALAVPLTGAPPPPPPPPSFCDTGSAGGWSTVFRDEFAAGVLNETLWNVEVGSAHAAFELPGLTIARDGAQDTPFESHHFPLVFGATVRRHTSLLRE